MPAPVPPHSSPRRGTSLASAIILLVATSFGLTEASWMASSVFSMSTSFAAVPRAKWAASSASFIACIDLTHITADESRKKRMTQTTHHLYRSMSPSSDWPSIWVPSLSAQTPVKHIYVIMLSYAAKAKVDELNLGAFGERRSKHRFRRGPHILEIVCCSRHLGTDSQTSNTVNDAIAHMRSLK